MSADYEKLFAEWTGDSERFSKEVQELARSCGAPSSAYQQLSSGDAGKQPKAAELTGLAVPNLPNLVRLLLNSAALEADSAFCAQFTSDQVDALIPFMKACLREKFEGVVKANKSFLAEKSRFPGLAALE